jgi:hypothetical protein
MIKMPKPIRTAQIASKSAFVITGIFRAFCDECKHLSGLFSRLRPSPPPPSSRQSQKLVDAALVATPALPTEEQPNRVGFFL